MNKATTVLLPCRKIERQSQLPVSQLRLPRHLPRLDTKETTKRRRTGRTLTKSA